MQHPFPAFQRPAAALLCALACGAAAAQATAPAPASASSTTAVYSSSAGVLSAPAVNIPGGGIHAATLQLATPGQPLAVGSLLNLVSSHSLSLQEAARTHLPQTFQGTDQTIVLPGVLMAQPDGSLQYCDLTLALLPSGQGFSIECVRFLGGREAGILADGPGPARIHGRAGAAGKGLDPRQAAQMRQVLDVGLGIKRLDLDPFQRVPGQAVGIGAPQLLAGELAPGLEMLVGA